jgi:hypothetical protein
MSLSLARKNCSSVHSSMGSRSKKVIVCCYFLFLVLFV